MLESSGHDRVRAVEPPRRTDRAGPRPARAHRPGRGTRLADLGWWDGDAPVEGTELAVWALARSPDPDLALAGARAALRESLDEAEWATLAEALRVDQGLRGRLFGVLGGSTALGDHLVAHPERWRSLQSETHARAHLRPLGAARPRGAHDARC